MTFPLALPSSLLKLFLQKKTKERKQTNNKTKKEVSWKGTPGTNVCAYCFSGKSGHYNTV